MCEEYNIKQFCIMVISQFFRWNNNQLTAREIIYVLRMRSYWAGGIWYNVLFVKYEQKYQTRNLLTFTLASASLANSQLASSSALTTHGNELPSLSHLNAYTYTCIQFSLQTQAQSITCNEATACKINDEDQEKAYEARSVLIILIIYSLNFSSILNVKAAVSPALRKK